MVATVRRLERGGRGIGAEVRRKSRVDDAFKYLGDEVEVGDGTVAGKIIGR
jgi:hypothetical protein